MREVGALIAEVLQPHLRRRRPSPPCGRRSAALTDRFPLYRWKLDPVRALSEWPLHIVIDARRVRDFGIGTYIRSLVHALGAIDTTNQYMLVSAAGGRADALRAAAEFQHRHLRARRDSSALDHVAFPLFLRGLSPDLVHIPLNRVPLLMTSLRGDRPRYGQPAVRGAAPDVRMQLRRFRLRRGLVRASRVMAVSDATRRDVEKLLGIARGPHPPGLQRARSRVSPARRTDRA